MPERQIQRANLCRMKTFTFRESDGEDGDGFTIDGYAAVFDTPTRIDSWEGTFDEQFKVGAFKRSLGQRVPKMQFDHGYHPLLGSLPLGVWNTMAEEPEAGLHAVGRLLDNWLVEPFRDAIAAQAVDGMSIRFSVIRDEWTDGEGKKVKDDDLLDLLWTGGGDRGPLLRTIVEAALSEAGPVTWPAYETTSVGVRSRQVVIDLGRLNDPGQRKDLARAVFAADAASRTMTINNDARSEHQNPPAKAPAPAAPPVAPDLPASPPSDPAASRRDRMRKRASSVSAYMALHVDGRARAIDGNRDRDQGRRTAAHA